MSRIKKLLEGGDPGDMDSPQQGQEIKAVDLTKKSFLVQEVYEEVSSIGGDLQKIMCKLDSVLHKLTKI